MNEKIATGTGTLLKKQIIFFIFKKLYFFLFKLLYKQFLAGAGRMSRSRNRSRLDRLHNNWQEPKEPNFCAGTGP